MVNKAKKELKDFIEKWIGDENTKDPELKLDSHKFVCSECNVVFSVTTPINTYISIYEVNCPKCVYHRDDIQFNHFYIN